MGGWLPDHIWKKQQKGNGKGGGGWKSGGGGGWKKKTNSVVNPKKTVWIGGIPDKATYKELKELGDQCGGCVWAEVYKNKGKGTGAIGFASEEARDTAVPSLNGAMD